MLRIGLIGCRLIEGGFLFHRKRFPGQGCLLNIEVFRFKQSCVGGDEVASKQAHDIAWNNFAPGDLFPIAVTKNRCRAQSRFPAAVRLHVVTGMSAKS